MESAKLYRGDPFYVHPHPRAFYYPTREKHIDNVLKKQNVLSPERLRHPKECRSPDEEAFLSGTNGLLSQVPTRDASSPGDLSAAFEESWPSSERPSSVSLQAPDELSPISMASGSRQSSHGSLAAAGRDRGPITGQQQVMTAEDDRERMSTLSKYIERFRHGAPMSKAERLRNQATNPGDFWWLSSSTPPTPTSSSTPRDEQQEGEEKRGERGRKVTSANSYASPLLNKGAAKRLSTGSSSSTRAPSSDSSRTRLFLPPEDRLSKELQEKADRLLEKSASSLNSSEPVVSTDGLGSSPSAFSGADEEIAYRPQFTQFTGLGESRADLLPTRLAPEDDILQQWRLRRKMELARRAPPTTDFSHRFTKDYSRTGASGLVAGDIRNTDPVYPVNEKTGRHSPSPTRKEAAAPVSNLPTHDTDPHSPVRDPPQPCIASPTTKDQRGTVEPHLHMLCDILPCPRHTSPSCPRRHRQRPPGGQNRYYSSESDGSDEEFADCSRLSRKVRQMKHEEPVSGKVRQMQYEEPVSGKVRQMQYEEPVSGKDRQMQHEKPASRQGDNLRGRRSRSDHQENDKLMRSRDDKENDVRRDGKQSRSRKYVEVEKGEDYGNEKFPSDSSGKGRERDCKRIDIRDKQKKKSKGQDRVAKHDYDDEDDNDDDDDDDDGDVRESRVLPAREGRGWEDDKRRPSSSDRTRGRSRDDGGRSQTRAECRRSSKNRDSNLSSDENRDYGEAKKSRDHGKSQHYSRKSKGKRDSNIDNDSDGYTRVYDDDETLGSREYCEKSSKQPKNKNQIKSAPCPSQRGYPGEVGKSGSREQLVGSQSKKSQSKTEQTKSAANESNRNERVLDGNYTQETGIYEKGSNEGGNKLPPKTHVPKQEERVKRHLAVIGGTRGGRESCSDSEPELKRGGNIGGVLGNAISQVVRSRLVAGSPDTSPGSSMVISDSSRPVSSADASPLVGKPGTTTQHAKTTAQVQSPDSDEHALLIDSSDGEFQEDDILKELRQKRQRYINKLRDIELLLNRKEDFNNNPSAKA